MPPVSVQIQARQDMFPFTTPSVVQHCSGVDSECSCHRAIPASLFQLSKNVAAFIPSQWQLGFHFTDRERLVCWKRELVRLSCWYTQHALRGDWVRWLCHSLSLLNPVNVSPFFRCLFSNTTLCLARCRIHSGHRPDDSRNPWFRFRWCKRSTRTRPTLFCFVLVLWLSSVVSLWFCCEDFYSPLYYIVLRFGPSAIP